MTKQRQCCSVGALATLLLGACAITEPEAELEEVGDEEAELGGGPATPGAAGIGDPLYPTLGNGGYDVEHYHLDLRYATAAPTQAIAGTVTILGKATQALSRFNLDFAGNAVGAVTVDGRPATASWQGEELVITPKRAIKKGAQFVVVVANFAAVPTVPDPEMFLDAPFFVTPDGSAWAGQPHNAHRIFPSNDHPSDKATFSFLLDVPAGTTAVANGEQVVKLTFNGRTISSFVALEPMATELAQVVVGDFTVTKRGTHHGVIVRDVSPARLTADLAPKFAVELAHLDWMTGEVGAYPFRSYGSLAVDSDIGFALETQTLSLYPAFLFDFTQAQYEPTMVHELAHQWFGNSVAPKRWSDVWQSEGHATWYEFTFQIHPDSPEFEALAQEIYSLGDIFRFAFGPVAAPLSGDPLELFNPNVYYGGALALYALRQQVGDPTFRAIEREWVKRYRGKSVGTADFIALASEVSGQNLNAFLTAWLFGQTTPPMPGHPEWTADPVPLPPSGLVARPARADVPMKSLKPLLHRH